MVSVSKPIKATRTTNKSEHLLFSKLCKNESIGDHFLVVLKWNH